MHNQTWIFHRLLAIKNHSMVWLKYNAQFIDVVGIGDLLICNLTIRLEEKQCRLPVSSRTTTHPINMASYHMNLPVARSDVQNPPRPQAQAYWGLTQVPRYPPPKPLFAVRKFGRTRFLRSFPTPPARPPLVLPAFFTLPPRLAPLPPTSAACALLFQNVSYFVTVLVSGKPSRAA